MRLPESGKLFLGSRSQPIRFRLSVQCNEKALKNSDCLSIVVKEEAQRPSFFLSHLGRHLDDGPSRHQQTKVSIYFWVG